MFNKSKQDLIAVIDIGSASVGGAVLLLNRDHSQAEIIFAVRVPVIDGSERLSSGKLKHRLKPWLSVIGRVGNTLTLEAERKTGQNRSILKPLLFKEVVCFLSGSWVSSEVTVIKDQLPEPMKITESFLKSKLIKEFRGFKNKMRSSFGPDIDGVVIEQQLISSKLNGYEIDDLVGHLTQNLELTALQTAVASNVYKHFNKAISRSTGNNNITYHSHTLVGTRALQYLKLPTADIIYVDITNYSTDILNICGHRLYSTNPLYTGVKDQVRQLSVKLGVSETVTESYIKAENEGVLESEFSDHIGSLWLPIMENWLLDFKASIGANSKCITGSTIVVTTWKLMQPFFLKAIENMIESDDGFHSCKAQKPDLSEIENICHWRPKGEKDIFLVLNSILIVERLNSKNLTKV